MSQKFATGAMFALLVASLGLAGPAMPSEKPIKFYVQLVRGNDTDVSPAPGARPIGPKVSKKFRQVFKWRNYWEINRLEVDVIAGQKTKVRLSKEREVEIDLTESGKRRVTAFRNGKALCTRNQPIDEEMTIAGGDRDQDSVWFVVVRHDKPTN